MATKMVTFTADPVAQQMAAAYRAEQNSILGRTKKLLTTSYFGIPSWILIGGIVGVGLMVIR